MSTDNTTEVALVPIEESVFLSKDKSIKAINGIILFDNVEVTGMPGSQIIMMLSISSGAAYNLINQIYPEMNGGEYYIAFNLRLCLPGEY